MKVCVWITGHPIADTVGSQARAGLNTCPIYYTADLTDKIIQDHDIHIGYGILRGMDKVFRSAHLAGKPWFHIDKGYWKPCHYDGYYRISLNDTQQTQLKGLKPDYERWDALGLDILPSRPRKGLVMICPPTQPVREFFKLHDAYFGSDMKIGYHPDETPSFFRNKNSTIPLQDDLDRCCQVSTFNSSVGWEALRQGIPVVSDAEHSIVGAYQKLVDKSIHDDLEARRELFGLMAGLQLTLDEIRQGRLWPLMKTLLSTLVTTDEKL